MQTQFPTGIPIVDANTIVNIPFALTLLNDGSNATTAASLVTGLVTGTTGTTDFVMNANPSFASQESAIVSRRVREPGEAAAGRLVGVTTCL